MNTGTLYSQGVCDRFYNDDSLTRAMFVYCSYLLRVSQFPASNSISIFLPMKNTFLATTLYVGNYVVTLATLIQHWFNVSCLLGMLQI